MATGLDEPEANRVVVALDQVAIDAVKEADPEGDGRFRVSVSKDDVAHALAALQDEELPRARTHGVLETVSKGGLIASRSAEHAQFVAGLAGDLQRTLEGVDGVVRARVHLNVPLEESGGFREPVHPGHATASVLLEHRGEKPPLAVDAVERIVAGGVSGLAPADVTVVTISRAPAVRAEGPLTHIGPIAVARGSMRTLQVVLIVLAGLIAILSAVVASLMGRLRKVRVSARAAKPS